MLASQTEACKRVAKHISPHCSIYKQPHPPLFLVDTRVAHQHLIFLDNRQGLTSLTTNMLLFWTLALQLSCLTMVIPSTQGVSQVKATTKKKLENIYSFTHGKSEKIKSQSMIFLQSREGGLNKDINFIKGTPKV